MTVVASGRGAPDYFLNGTPVTAENGDTLTLSNLSPGAYRITAQLANACVTDTVIVIDELDEVRLLQTGSYCLADDPKTLGIDPNIASQTTDYAWSDGSSEATIVNPVAGQTYSVTVTLDGGCTRMGSIEVEATSSLVRGISGTLDCITGLDTLEILPEIDPEVDLLILGPDGEYERLTEPFIVSEPGFYFIRSDSTSICNARIIGRVADYRLSTISLFSERPFDCFLEEVAIGVEGLSTFDGVSEHSTTLTGPADSIIDFENAGTFFNLEGAREGIYTAEVSNTCGDTTLTYALSFPDTCASALMNIGGRVRVNTDGSCDPGVDTPGDFVPNTTVRVTADAREYFFVTDEEGRWQGRVPPFRFRDYTVRPLGLRDSSLVACSSRSITLDTSQTARDGNISVLIEEGDCANLEVTVSAVRLRRCFGNSAYVSYFNRSSFTGENTVLSVEVDEAFENVEASMAFTRVGNTLSFDLGTQAPFSDGNIRIDFDVSCDTRLGQLHCLEASVEADNICTPGSSSALVDVRAAECAADSVRFTITNIGGLDMSDPVEYFVFVDGVQDVDLSDSSPALAAGATLALAFPAIGKTYQVVSRQEAGYLGAASRLPSAIVTSCSGSPTGGNRAPYSLENGLGNRYTLCRTNIGSFDPNEKRVFPGGGFANSVEPGTRLTYELHFQNTGTDTAFTVVVRDTLPEALDVKTIEFGASSHDYEVMIDSGRVLTFTFDDINLVDSFTNVMGSMGVVAFSIDHVRELQRGDGFRNRAGIYFDFNEPIVTEYATTVLNDKPLLLSSTNITQAEIPALRLAPNPATDGLVVTAPESIVATDLLLTIVDASGRRVRSLPYRATGQWMDVNDLANGVYHLVLTHRGLAVGRGRFVVAR